MGARLTALREFLSILLRRGVLLCGPRYGAVAVVPVAGFDDGRLSVVVFHRDLDQSDSLFDKGIGEPSARYLWKDFFCRCWVVYVYSHPVPQFVARL